MARKNHDTLMFDTLHLEGALFVPDLLERAAQGRHTHQRDTDYRVPKGLKLHDEYGRAFQIAQAQWKAFAPELPRRDVNGFDATRTFFSELLRDVLSYTDLKFVEGVEAAGRRYPVSFMAAGRVPVVVAPHFLDLDEPDSRFAVEGSGSRKKSAFQLAQELLNAAPEAAWAIAGNGRRIRLIREAATLTRPSFLEFDLEMILTEARYPDFSALWRIFHASRAGNPETPGTECIWEQWRQEGLVQGTRVREGLRLGVTNALIALGEGFLKHPANEELRRALREGRLGPYPFFEQLLRLIYRFLFLFTVEERELLHPVDDTAPALVARKVYAEGYALRRLRDRALRRVGFDRYADLWQGIRIVFRGLDGGEPCLALPALGGLFSPRQCPDLDGASLGNDALLSAMRQLRWAEADGSLSPVDYRNMGPEELGSVYESLLELVPDVDLSARRFGFIGLSGEGAVAGHARKTTGSYYTPDPLVQELIKSALEPVMEARLAAQPESPVAALLSITVIDPACGSGHFLLAAARRLAERLAVLRSPDGAVKPEDYRHALREVIAICIYGVDKNPLAIELARTALWLEGFESGRPLSFLDHHLVCGDALLGLVDLKQLTKGVPDAAFTPLSGDDKTVCKKLLQQNRAARKLLMRRFKGEERLWSSKWNEAFLPLGVIETLPDDTPEAVAAKESAFGEFLEKAKNSPLAQAADLFIGAFLMPKGDDEVLNTAPTSEGLIVALFGDGKTASHEKSLKAAISVCREARVLHWPLAFAQVFAKGGFDCVLGNPPWERIKLQEQEFFASRHPDVATAKNKAERDRRIEWLSQGMLARHLHPGHALDEEMGKTEQRLYREFIITRRTAEAASIYAHLKNEDGGRYPLTGVGDVNTYALFAETISRIVSGKGRAGFIVPTGIATDDSTKAYFAEIAQSGGLASLLDFENRDAIFPGVHRSYKFCLLTLGKSPEARFSFFLTQTPQLADARRSFTLCPDDFRLINPNTQTCPLFRSRMDAELTRKIYARVPVLIREATEKDPEKNPWGIRFSAMFHMSNDSHLFADHDGGDHLPLYEAKMIHQFDHRWASYGTPDDGKVVVDDVPLSDKKNTGFTVRPRYWVGRRQVLARIARVPRAVAQAYAAEEGHKLLAALANWVEAGRTGSKALETVNESRNALISLAGNHFSALPVNPKDWRDLKIQADAQDYPALSDEELAVFRRASTFWEAAHVLMDRRSPRWLMGFRDICRSTDERTVIASVLPRAGVGNNLPLLMFDNLFEASNFAALIGNFSSLLLDFVARHKVGGTHLNFFVAKQLPILSPDKYSVNDLNFITPRVLELTYTAHDLNPWAKELGFTGPPFPFDPDRRAQLRAELDAYYARLYGLTRDELRYILDPADVMGPDYPTETFRVLKNNEEKAFGEYRTLRLVLQAWDDLEKGVCHQSPES